MSVFYVLRWQMKQKQKLKKKQGGRKRAVQLQTNNNS